ncbi:MAG: DUF262 domain-containing protein [Muribaculaceae bacterium]|nr:DUF262 domain-containing protein [Muribaculaceae bacterium]
MSDNLVDLRSIARLLDFNFFIPSYQRGYRWTTQQVKDLLEDVKDFCKDKNSSNFYCLQPIVVKQMSLEEKRFHDLEENLVWYEVIDGQQRLTTILLILTAYKDTLDSNDLPTEFYRLKFEREHLEQQKSLDGIEAIDGIDESTIDRYHISQAMTYIKCWRKQKLVNAADFCNAFLKTEPDEQGKDNAKNIRVIWYESIDEDPITVFTRLNIGKISLTNAELIKAVMLNCKNFQRSQNEEIVRLRQQEIASEWDTIETTLQDESFWMFLHDGKYNRPTRIDFIFDLLQKQNVLSLSEDALSQVGSDEFQTFRYFYAFFNDKKLANVENCWEKIKYYFQAFVEWYNDPEFYHYIGYLLNYSTPDIVELIKQWNIATSKKAFKRYLKDQIKSKLSNCPALDFQYNIDGSNKGKCKAILLFHNIQTAINANKNSKSRTIGMAYRFPFDSYKNESWDVEHICSNTTNPEDDESTRKEWLMNVYLSVPEDIQQEIRDYFEDQNKTEDKTRILFDKVKSYIPEIERWTQEDKNKIWNYVLLDSSTNRSYGNAIFSAKRRIIIGKDSGVEISIPKLNNDKIELPDSRKGLSRFVPPVTKKVFLKYYSSAASNSNYWDLNIDAKAYRHDIESCINQLDNDDNGEQ